MTDSRWDRFADRASARRAAARMLHPDVGGDGERLAAALDAIDRRFGNNGGLGQTAPVEILIRHSRLHPVKDAYRRTRGRLHFRRRRYLSL